MIPSVDSHCHLQAKPLCDIAGQLVDEARAAGVEQLLIAGIQPSEIPETARLAESLGVWFSVGCHPCHADEWDAAPILEWKDHPRVVAIGECGLDYYHKPFDAAMQQRVFREQIRIANAAGLPLILHNRESDADLVALLRQENANSGVFHCFGADHATLDAALELGFFVSFAGNVTYPKATFRELVSSVPSDRLLIETDCPWLSPVPHRGKTNHPALVTRVLEEVARLRGEDPTSLGRQVVSNFGVCFPRTSNPSGNAA